MSAIVPRSVACPCGNGYAERRPEPIVEPGRRRKQRTIWHYRHDGCPLGGTMVVEFGRIVRRTGPLFRAERYDVAEFQQPAPEPQQTPKPLVADGGEPS